MPKQYFLKRLDWQIFIGRNKQKYHQNCLASKISKSKHVFLKCLDWYKKYLTPVFNVFQLYYVELQNYFESLSSSLLLLYNYCKNNFKKMCFRPTFDLLWFSCLSIIRSHTPKPFKPTTTYW